MIDVSLPVWKAGICFFKLGQCNDWCVFAGLKRWNADVGRIPSRFLFLLLPLNPLSSTLDVESQFSLLNLAPRFNFRLHSLLAAFSRCHIHRICWLLTPPVQNSWKDAPQSVHSSQGPDQREYTWIRSLGPRHLDRGPLSLLTLSFALFCHSGRKIHAEMLLGAACV